MDEKIQQPETQQAIFLAMLIELAENNGVIRLTGRQLIEEAEKRKIFIGSQSNLWLRRELKKLIDCKALQVFNRIKKTKHPRLGMHYYYKLNSNKTVLFEILDKLPVLKNVEVLKTKLLLNNFDVNENSTTGTE